MNHNPHFKGLYPNNLKSWEFDEEAPQNFRSERAAFAEGKGSSENENSEIKPTRSKTNFSSCLGILLVDKERSSTSFQIVSQLRRLTKEQTIGHAGTLDPFATGVMVMLIGREFTRRSDSFLSCDKAYRATLTLGVTTDTYDLDGQIIDQSDIVPSLNEVESTLALFQGEIEQIPPMFSAKKIEGKKLYELARKGVVIERQPVKVRLAIHLIRYSYPHLEITVDCSKGTYIRSLAYDIGQALGCGAHLTDLVRIRSGTFTLEECIPQALLKNPQFNITPHLRNL